MTVLNTIRIWTIASEVTERADVDIRNALTSEQRGATENWKYIKDAYFLLVIFFKFCLQELIRWTQYFSAKLWSKVIQ